MDYQTFLEARKVSRAPIERTTKSPGDRVLTSTRCHVIADDGGIDDPNNYDWPTTPLAILSRRPRDVAILLAIAACVIVAAVAFLAIGAK